MMSSGMNNNKPKYIISCVPDLESKFQEIIKSDELKNIEIEIKKVFFLTSKLWYLLPQNLTAKELQDNTMKTITELFF